MTPKHFFLLNLCETSKSAEFFADSKFIEMGYSQFFWKKGKGKKYANYEFPCKNI
jgi:hypothetical protein